MSQLRNAIIANLGGSTPPTPPTPVDDGVLRFTIDTSYGKNFGFTVSGATDYVVNWGDGTTNTGTYLHTYTDSDIYHVTITKGISNNFPSVVFSNSEIVTSIDSPIPFMNGVTTFNYFLSSCPHVTHIDENLFYFNPQITKADGIITNNSLITSLPTKLMEPLVNVTTLISSFAGLSSLTSVPNGFFDNCTKVTRFYRTFKNCTNLATIPDLLFKNNVLATDFNQCFMNCNKLTIPQNLFCNDETERTTRFATLGYVDFDSCFMRDSFTGTGTMIVPELWDYTFSTTPGRWGCYGNSGNNGSNIINYYSIPTTWGGAQHPFTVLDHCYFNNSPVSLGFKFTANVTQFKISFTAQNSNWILGARDYQTSSERFTIQAGTSTAIITNNISATTTTNIGSLSSRIDYTYNGSVITIVNNNNTYTSNNTRGFPNGNRVIMLGSIRNGSTIQTANNLVGYFWGLRIYESNTITHNIIPIKDGSNVVCLYDTIAGGEYKYPTSGTLLEDAPIQLNMINPGSLQMDLNNDGDELDVEPTDEEEER